MSFATGTIISIPVFVRFQKSATWLPPVGVNKPTVKSAGGVLSNITFVLFVETVTATPSLPAKSENWISKVASPSASESVGT